MTQDPHGAGPRWADRLARVESRNVTRLVPPPPFWTDARGSAVLDADGRRYIDLGGAFGVAFAGHRHPVVMDRVRRQADALVHGMGDVHPPAVKVEFLERLAQRLPWPDSRAILGLSGADAVEAALKTAQLATGRIGLIAFEGGYHGLSLGALATTHREHFRRPFARRLVDHVRFVPFPATDADAEVVLDRVAALLAGRSADGRPAPAAVGALLVEPIQGRGGVRIPPSGFLARLHQRVRDAGALLVADEIFTGLGRTGSMYACDHEGVVPDLLCLGKALGGGMPLSACAGPAGVMDAWPPSSGEAIHTSTFLGHPLSCAAGIGFLDALESEGLAERAADLGRWTLDYLRSELEGVGRVTDVRGRGLMVGVEMSGRGAADTDPPGAAARRSSPVVEAAGRGAAGRSAAISPAAAVAARALKRGVVVLPAGARGAVVEITPPATIGNDDLERGLAVVAEAIRSVAG